MNEIDAIKSFVDSLPDAMLFLNPDLQVTWWNRAARDWLELDREKKNLTLQELLPFPNIESYCLSAHLEPMEAKLTGPTSRQVALSVIEYQEQRILCLRDITHLHRLEKIREDFVANVSHELRTPLTVVHGYLESLLEEDKTSEALQTSILKKIYQQSHRMYKLIEDLLFLASIEAEQTDEHSTQIDVPRLVSQLFDDAKILSGERQHQFHFNIDTSLMLYGHEKELQGAFANLIVNAVNYTPAREQISITWQADAKGAYFIVRDTGQGIASHHLARLTERFYRVDKARSRDSGGTGLGLAIVKHVLIRHDAQLLIESELDVGSSFICHFPIQRYKKVSPVSG